MNTFSTDIPDNIVQCDLLRNFKLVELNKLIKLIAFMCKKNYSACILTLLEILRTVETIF